MNILSSGNTRCVLCNTEDETIPHLFFNCQFAWRVWGACCDWWGIKWVMSNDPGINFEAWISARCPRHMKRGWISNYYAVIWAIWNLRNQVIFQNKSICWQTFMMELWHMWKSWNEIWEGGYVISQF